MNKIASGMAALLISFNTSALAAYDANAITYDIAAQIGNGVVDSYLAGHTRGMFNYIGECWTDARDRGDQTQAGVCVVAEAIAAGVERAQSYNERRGMFAEFQQQVVAERIMSNMESLGMTKEEAKGFIRQLMPRVNDANGVVLARMR